MRDQSKRKNVTTEIFNRYNKRDVIDMSSSVQTIFILIACMAALAQIVFILEYHHVLYTECCVKLRNMLRHTLLILGRLCRMGCSQLVRMFSNALTEITNTYCR